MENQHILSSHAIFSAQQQNVTDSTAEIICRSHQIEIYSTFFSVSLAVPEWEAVLTSLILSLIIVLTIVGNILVILSVFTYKPLRIAQNFFIVSLAAADLAVALLVLPFNVAYSVLGRWEFGIHMCKVWLTFDVMCCTSSILNLCGIALDRFWAITDPINYAHKRTITRVLVIISGVWILSFLISSPPLFGWNDWPSQFTSSTPCELTSNRGYVIYSALGSFYIPLAIMTVVYFQIYIATKRRLRERAQAPKVQKAESSVMNSNRQKCEVDDQHCECHARCGLHLVCCLTNTHRTTTTIAPDEKESCSSDTQINSEINTETFKRKTFQASVLTDISSPQRTQSKKSQEIRQPEKLNFPAQKKASYVKKSEARADIHKFVEERQKISLSKERRAARTLGIIMGVFIICWLPFFLMYVVLPFCKTCCPTQKLKNFIAWLGYINSSLNPIIYTIFNSDYRCAFKKLIGLK